MLLFLILLLASLSIMNGIKQNNSNNLLRKKYSRLSDQELMKIYSTIVNEREDSYLYSNDRRMSILLGEIIKRGLRI